MKVAIFEYTPHGEHSLQIALVSFERQRTHSDVASFLYDEHRAFLQRADVLIIRPPVDIPVSNYPDEMEKAMQIVQRFPHLPCHVLYSVNYIIQLSENINGKSKNNFLKTEKTERFLEFVRQKELEDFVLHSSALFKCPANAVYRMPSQEFSHAFLRVGNIQTSKHVLDSIFFWVLPHLKGAGSILTDSWSISSIALNIARLLCRYDSKVSLSEFHVNMLTNHYTGLKKLDRETREVLLPLTSEDDKRILFLISAIKTEKSLENITRAFEGINIARAIEKLALYKLVKKTETPALCDLSRGFPPENPVAFDSFKKKPKGEKVIEIDENAFFPMKVTETEVNLRKAATLESADFFRRYEGKNVFYIHRDSYYLNKDRFRHHGIYLDVSKLLLCTEFLKKLNACLATLKKNPSYIIYPPHEHGRDMVRIVCDILKLRFGTEPKCYCGLDSDFTLKEDGKELATELQKLSEDDLIMVIDDVSTTGARLRGYQKKIRDFFSGQICYFIGVARPDKIEDWNGRVADFEYRPSGTAGKRLAKHIVCAVETLILPDWDEKKCPWCIEKSILSTVISKEEYQDYPLVRSLKRRFYELDNGPEYGLLDNVFYSLNAEPKPKFQGKSVMSDNTQISEADLVTIIATSIQFLRNVGASVKPSGRNKLELDYPFFKIIKIKSYMGADPSFDEGLIKAGILRSSYRDEIFAMSEANRQIQLDGVKRFLKGKDIKKEEICYFIYEIYLALKMKKLPRPLDKKLLGILERAFKKDI